MSVSALFGTRLVSPPAPSLAVGNGGGAAEKKAAPVPGMGAALIECSSRPQKKATAHHIKTRPRKTQPWDVKRRPAVYPPLPPLPADWSFVAADTADAVPPPPSEAPESVVLPSV